MALSDDLYKIDAHVEGVMRRIANLLFSALNEQNKYYQKRNKIINFFYYGT